jgi:hypothetical protein
MDETWRSSFLRAITVAFSGGWLLQKRGTKQTSAASDRLRRLGEGVGGRNKADNASRRLVEN